VLQGIYEYNIMSASESDISSATVRRLYSPYVIRSHQHLSSPKHSFSDTAHIRITHSSSPTGAELWMKLSSEEVYLPFIFLSGRACHASGPASLIRDTQCVLNSSEPHILDLGCVPQAFFF
jgi:hypothetical protein